MDLVRSKISDRGILELIELFLNQSIMEELKEWTPEAGVPQGAVLSLLSNLYLNELDHRMARNGYEMVRYADDFVILCRTQEQAECALEEVKRFVTEVGLTLHPDKTHIVDSREKCFAFLGYSFRKHLPAREEPSQDGRHVTSTNSTQVRRTTRIHDCPNQSRHSRLVQLLSSLYVEHFRSIRRNGPQATASPTHETSSLKPETSMSHAPLAKCLLH